MRVCVCVHVRPLRVQAAPRIAAAAARRRAAETTRVETAALAQALLEEEGGEGAAEAQASHMRAVRWAVGVLVGGAACALLVLAAVGLAMSADEVALCALVAVPAASLGYDRLLPRALLLALPRAAGPPPATDQHRFRYDTSGTGGMGGLAPSAGARCGHSAVRVRHCASDLEDEMLMKAGDKLPAAGRRSSTGAGATGPARPDLSPAAAYFSAQREGFYGRIPRRVSHGPESSGRLSPPRSRTLPELDEALNA